MNSKRECQFVKPNTRAQSIRLLISKNSNWALDLSESLKIWLFRSFHNSHIQHNGTKFHTSNEWFPNQFLHPNKRDPGSSFSSNSYKNIYFVFINHIYFFLIILISNKIYWKSTKRMYHPRTREKLLTFKRLATLKSNTLEKEIQSVAAIHL